jgi:hypothetical protein
MCCSSVPQPPAAMMDRPGRWAPEAASHKPDSTAPRSYPAVQRFSGSGQPKLVDRPLTRSASPLQNQCLAHKPCTTQGGYLPCARVCRRASTPHSPSDHCGGGKREHAAYERQQRDSPDSHRACTCLNTWDRPLCLSGQVACEPACMRQSCSSDAATSKQPMLLASSRYASLAKQEECIRWSAKRSEPCVARQPCLSVYPSGKLFFSTSVSQATTTRI